MATMSEFPLFRMKKVDLPDLSPSGQSLVRKGIYGLFELDAPRGEGVFLLLTDRRAVYLLSKSGRILEKTEIDFRTEKVVPVRLQGEMAVNGLVRL